MGRGTEGVEDLSERQQMRERRRKRRRDRRLGRSRNPDPKAISERVWYHGTPEGGFSVEEIDIKKGDRDIEGFYLASLKPVADFYRRADAFFYGWEVSKRASVYRLRVEVANPLNMDAAPDPDLLHFLEQLKEEIRGDDFVGDEKSLSFLQEQEDYKTNAGVLFSFIGSLKSLAVASDGVDRVVRRRARRVKEDFSERLLLAGWDSLVRRMRGGPDEKVTAFHSAEELILLDPKRQIKEMTS